MTGELKKKGDYFEPWKLLQTTSNYTNRLNILLAQAIMNEFLNLLMKTERRRLYLYFVKTYSYTIANAAIWLATLLAIYSSIDSSFFVIILKK